MNELKPLFLAALGCSLLAASSVHAQAFDAQQLRFSPNQHDNYFGQHSARTLESGGLSAGLVLHYANDPLVLVDADDERVASVVGDQLVANALFAIGVLDILEIGLDMPFVLYQDGDTLPRDSGLVGSDSPVGLGDLHAMVKLSLWNRDTARSPGGTAFALVVDAQLPTGSEQDFRGEGLRIEPRAVLDYAFPRSLRLSAQVGYLVRPETTLLGAEVDDTLTLGLGADLPLDEAQRWHVLGEGSAKVSVLASSLDTAEAPVETMIGARYYDDSGVMVQAGAGFGINAGFGTPDYRLLAGVAYRTPTDRSREGFYSDICPDGTEDIDGFEDDDGCRDPDNDKDGILDASDRCPNDPEDIDGFEDTDGCPEPDNDKDGLLDAADRCPSEPEDRDGFEDEDGCPDPDNDQDGILDAADACPIVPEDRDSFEDTDGCPEPDNDKDGLLDAADECPLEPEDFDGFEDDDGCPEAGSGLVKLTCEKIEIAESVYFDTASDRIQARSFGLLEQVASVLKSASYVKQIRIEGHTDDRGKDKFNLDLSIRRASSVLRFLSERGIAADRLTSEGFGEARPVETNKTRDGRAANRRVEFMITAQDACAPTR
jgi:outer membrane protein OmpA-like peptidoglycan-associated protein